MYVLEREVQPDKFYFTNSLFFVAITMTTVGDGEKMAITIWGRILTVVSTYCDLAHDAPPPPVFVVAPARAHQASFTIDDTVQLSQQTLQ
jgi:hypothetical protein